MSTLCPNCSDALDPAHDCLIAHPPALEHAELELTFAGRTTVFVPRAALHRARTGLSEVKRAAHKAVVALAKAREEAEEWRERCVRLWENGDDSQLPEQVESIEVRAISPVLIESDGPICSRGECPAFYAGHCLVTGADIYATDGDAPCEGAA